MAIETPSLLIVHQNLNMAKTLATLLAKEYNVYIAKLASHVADQVESNRIELVLASQQLPDSTGLALFDRLRQSHPEVVRILLVSDSDLAGIDIEMALSGEIIHRYLTEPLRSSHFLSSIRKGIELFESRAGALKGTNPAQPIPEEAAPPVYAPQEEPGEKEPETSDTALPAFDEVEQLEAAGLSYEAIFQKQQEVQHALERLQEKDQRIEQLEAVQKALTEDKEELLEKMVQLQMENAALGVLRQENSAMREEMDRLRAEGAQELERVRAQAAEDADRIRAEAGREIESAVAKAASATEQLKAEMEALRAENGRMHEQAQGYRSEREAIQAEADKLREELNSLGRLKALGPASAPLTASELEQTVDALEIYSKAAQWCMQAFQLQRLNEMLEIDVQKSELEISRLHEGMAGLRTRFEHEQAGLLRQSRQLDEQYRALRQESQAREVSCDRLRKERDELARKVSWMQAQWKAKQEQNEEG